MNNTDEQFWSNSTDLMNVLMNSNDEQYLWTVLIWWTVLSCLQLSRIYCPNEKANNQNVRRVTAVRKVVLVAPERALICNLQHGAMALICSPSHDVISARRTWHLAVSSLSGLQNLADQIDSDSQASKKEINNFLRRIEGEVRHEAFC